MNFPISQNWLCNIVDFSVKTRFLNSDIFIIHSQSVIQKLSNEQAIDKQTWLRVQDQHHSMIIISLDISYEL